MSLQDLLLHPDFPRRVWVVVEQPAHEEFRIQYDPVSEQFVRSNVKSLPFARGWSGAYGWVGGLGTPPGRHLDVYLVTWKETAPGEIIAACVCGIFYRRDHDHKLMALDVELEGTVERPDLACFDATRCAEVMALYPTVASQEGWYGAAEAQAYLIQHTATFETPGR